MERIEELNKLLIAAVISRSVEEVEAMILAGADVNTESFNGSTALMYVSERGHIEIVKLLIENGADVNTENDCGDTALMLASEEGHTEIVKLLKGARAVRNNKQKGENVNEN